MGQRKALLSQLAVAWAPRIAVTDYSCPSTAGCSCIVANCSHTNLIASCSHTIRSSLIITVYRSAVSNLSTNWHCRLARLMFYY